MRKGNCVSSGSPPQKKNVASSSQAQVRFPLPLSSPPIIPFGILSRGRPMASLSPFTSYAILVLTTHHPIYVYAMKSLLLGGTLPCRDRYKRLLEISYPGEFVPRRIRTQKDWVRILWLIRTRVRIIQRICTLYITFILIISVLNCIFVLFRNTKKLKEINDLCIIIFLL